jgi:hypothetical protein
MNYTSSGELPDHTTTVVNSCFSTMVADLLNDPDHKIMAGCKQCLDCVEVVLLHFHRHCYKSSTLWFFIGEGLSLSDTSYE